MLSSTYKTYQQIDWSNIIALLTQYCHFTLNKDISQFTLFTTNRDELTCAYDQIDKWTGHFLDNPQIKDELFANLASDEDYSKLIQKIEKSQVLGIYKLNFIANTLENIKHTLHLHDVLVDSYQHNIRSMLTFLRKIRHVITKTGEESFDNLPEINEQKKIIQSIDRKVKSILNEWINDPHQSNALQFSNWDIIYDRYVLPIRSDSYNYSMGSIISRSESGHTLYVEPSNIRDLSNNRIQAINIIEEFKNKYILEANSLLQNINEFSIQALNYIASIDKQLAKSIFCLNKSLTRPEICDSLGIKLHGFFNPLIDNCISNNIELKSTDAGLLISGPNMGGKTVALKSISLCITLAQAGLFVPAKFASLSIFGKIHYFGHDTQSILDGQSSFSGEVNQYINALSNIGQLPELFVFDEIFNTTSSEEASVLAYSLFNYIQESNSLVLASTHHQTLKTFVHKDKKFISAHVEYDEKMLKSTYKLILGIPGPSYAINVFRDILKEHDFSADLIIQKAQTLLDNKMLHYEALISELSQEKSKFSKLNHELKSKQREINNLKESNLALLKLEREKQNKNLLKELEKIKRDYINRLDEAKTEKKIDIIHHETQSKLVQQEPSLLTQAPAENGVNKIKINQIKVGDTFYSHSVGHDIVVQRIDYRKKTVFASKGKISINVPISSLDNKKNLDTNKTKVGLELAPKNLTLDARGMRLDEFETEVEMAISGLYSQQIPYLEIIHGHGDGVLKSWLRSYILKNKDIIQVEDDSGNDGSTRLKIIE